MIDHPHTYVSPECAKWLNRWASESGVHSWASYLVQCVNPNGSRPITVMSYDNILLRPELWVDELNRRYIRWFISEKPEWIEMTKALEIVESQLKRDGA